MSNVTTRSAISHTMRRGQNSAYNNSSLLSFCVVFFFLRLFPFTWYVQIQQYIFHIKGTALRLIFCRDSRFLTGVYVCEWCCYGHSDGGRCSQRRHTTHPCAARNEMARRNRNNTRATRWERTHSNAMKSERECDTDGDRMRTLRNVLTGELKRYTTCHVTMIKCFRWFFFTRFFRFSVFTPFATLDVNVRITYCFHFIWSITAAMTMRCQFSILVVATVKDEIQIFFTRWWHRWISFQKLLPTALSFVY